MAFLKTTEIEDEGRGHQVAICDQLGGVELRREYRRCRRGR